MTAALDGVRVLEPGDRATLHRLLERADVLVETAPPARRAELGLDPEALRARNPGLIHVSVTPFGSNAEWRDWRANDLVACAAGGLLCLCGEQGSPPVQGAANPAFTMASLVAATGVMVALATRDRDPVRAGAHLDISLQEATVMTVVQTANASWWTWNGHVPGRPGLSAALRCKDGGWIGFVPRPDRFDAFLEWVESEGIESGLSPDDWPRARIGAPSRGNPVNAATRQLAARLTLARLIGPAELAGDPRFATHAARKAHEDALDEIVSALTGQRERWELAAELQAAGIAAAPVESLRDTYERDPQLRHHYQQVRQPTAPETDIPIDGEAIGFSGHPHRLQRAPMLGEHNESVLSGIVGLPQREYERLALDEVVA